MKKNPYIYLEHILECISLIEEYTRNLSLEDFKHNSLVQDSTFRRLEIIGEAVKQIPNDFRDSHSEVEWKKIAGLRDKLIHEYFGIDIELTWEIVQNKLPQLKENILRIMIRPSSTNQQKLF